MTEDPLGRVPRTRRLSTAEVAWYLGDDGDEDDEDLYEAERGDTGAAGSEGDQ